MKNTPNHYSAVFCAASLFCLLGTFLFPVGMGLWLGHGFPKFDMPRMATLGIYVVFFASLFWGIKFDWMIAPRTMIVMAALSIMQLLGLLINYSGTLSLIWNAAYIINYWFFCVVALHLIAVNQCKKMVYNLFLFGGIFLAAWSSLEFLTQEKLFPYRNIYINEGNQFFSTTLRRRVVLNGEEIGPFPLMSLGPFFSNLPLALYLCLFSGFFLIVKNEKNFYWYIFLSALLGFAVLSTQSRTGLATYFITVFVALFYNQEWRSRIAISVGGLLGLILFVFFFGINDFIASFGYGILDMSGVQVLAHSESATDSEIQRRVIGLSSAYVQTSSDVKSLLFGVGAGTIFDSNRVHSLFSIVSDQGSFFSIIIENGIISGTLLLYLISSCIVASFRTDDKFIIVIALGVVGFICNSLVSIHPNAWGIALVFIGLVEAWSKSARSEFSSGKS